MSAQAEIRSLFEPQSIAVIGASSVPTKIGYKLLQNIVEMGYQGTIYPVNPKGGTILGLPVYPSIRDVAGDVDVAVLVIPANRVYETVVACGEKGVRHLSIISSGFSEVGNVEEEQKIVSYARAHGMRVLGPNIFGHYSAKVSLNATFGPRDIRPGNVAIITQSGALGVAMIGKTSVQNIGLSAIISVGNKSDIDETDLIEYLIHQEETEIILMYIEGIHGGDRLVAKLKEATRLKPVIVIKSGRSKRGAMAAASHTGSLAGADEVFDAIMKQCGVFRAESIQDALDWCKYLSQAPIPRGKNSVIITNGGGIGVLATDACEKYRVHLYDDTERLRLTFEEVTHGFGSTKNPIDITGEATRQDYETALLRALEDPDIHSVIGLYCETAVMDSAELSDMIRSTYVRFRDAHKPMVFSIFGGELTEEALVSLAQDNIPVYRDVYEAVACLGVLHAHGRNLDRPVERFEPGVVDTRAVDRILDAALAEGRHFLLAHEGQSILQAVGLEGPGGGVAKSISQAVELADSIGYPVVMKVVSRDILHKSDAGGVLLHLMNREEVMDAYQTIMHNCKTQVPDARIEGVEVVRQIPPGMEVIVGGRRDRSFGPILMFGLGGIYVEVMKDVAFRALPVTRKEIMTMIKTIKSYPLLLGVRGEPRRDIEGVEAVLQRVGDLLLACPRITDFEINPLMVYPQGQGVMAVDVRVLIRDREGDPS
ncbi:MAG: CoA-binding protein [Candidatus Neomarinimicrobiota bacterium]|nr:MAG: CoA-binding protein [Candidatus Neomarinimicrobiota bacterium]